MRMKREAWTVDQYIDELSNDRKEVILKIRSTILENLPEGFQEEISYGMIWYVVPHSIYPDGYHCTPDLPLPFINIASQKNHIGFYHMWLYADTNILKWFEWEYPKYCSKKLDMWKCCIRFKKMDEIPYKLLWELVKKFTVKQWINLYESAVKK
jgi:uncharacterized protein YdhG (YjbR/CyaY superfamily)